MPDGQIFHVITRGSGMMPAYAGQIAPEDRWKVVAWVRTLQGRACWRRCSTGCCRSSSCCRGSPSAIRECWLEPPRWCSRGRWLDLYLIVAPAVLPVPRLGPLEILITAGYAGLFYLAGTRILGRAPLLARNDPFLPESLHHHA